MDLRLRGGTVMMRRLTSLFATRVSWYAMASMCQLAANASLGETIGKIRCDRRHDQQQGSRRQADPAREHANEDGDRERARRDGDDAGEVDEVVHALDSPRFGGGKPGTARRRANTFLTRVSLPAHAVSRYCSS